MSDPRFRIVGWSDSNGTTEALWDWIFRGLDWPIIRQYWRRPPQEGRSTND